MEEAARVAAGRAVLEVELHLLDAETRPRRVDRHARLATEPRCKREDRSASARRERALARERLDGLESREHADQPSRDALGETEAAADALAEDRDVDVRIPGEQRAQVAAQVCVAEEQPARRGRPLGRRERLPLAEPAQREHGRPRGLGPLGRAVARAVVGDEHLRLREPRS